MRRPRLLLVEDDPALGPLVEEVLSEVYDVDRRTDGRDGLRAGLTRPFDAMVVDRRLPSLDGVSLVQALRAEQVSAPVLMLTALGSVPDRVAGLDGGADDYLVKPFDFDELLARLRALTRSFPPAQHPLPIGTWWFSPSERVVASPYGGRFVLTVRESEVLRVLAEQPDQTFSREHLLREVFADGDQPGTVDTYVHHLRRKTEKDIVLTIRNRGYRLGSL